MIVFCFGGEHFPHKGELVLSNECSVIVAPAEMAHFSRESRLLQILALGSVHSIRGAF